MFLFTRIVTTARGFAVPCGFIAASAAAGLSSWFSSLRLAVVPGVIVAILSITVLRKFVSGVSGRCGRLLPRVLLLRRLRRLRRLLLLPRLLLRRLLLPLRLLRPLLLCRVLLIVAALLP